MDKTNEKNAVVRNSNDFLSENGFPMMSLDELTILNSQMQDDPDFYAKIVSYFAFFAKKKS